jgi:hypothetical protein
MGRGPVCGIITRLAGTDATVEAAEATVDSADGVASVAAEELAAIGCSVVAAGAIVDSAIAVGVCGTRDVAGAAGIADLVSCGALFAGAATTEAAPANPDAGGFTITGPEGAREAMAGVGASVAATICGAWRGKGTIFRGEGFDPTAALADTVLAVAALATVPAEAGVGTACPAAEEAAAGVETAGFAGPAAAAVTVGRGAAVAPRCVPCCSRCSFCC